MTATPSPQPNHERGYGVTGYFPQQQQQPSYHPTAHEVETLSNPFPNPQGDYGSHLVAPIATRPARFTEEWDASQRGSSIIDGAGTGGNMQRSSVISNPTTGITGDGAGSLSRGNTLRKKASLRRSTSLRRSGSRRSMKAGSVRSLALQSTTDQDEMHSAFYCPVPTAGSPTEVLANRFQAWRKILKDLITYFREIQTHYEHRAKSLLKLANVLNNTATPPGFLASGGLDDALQILRNYNKQAIAEANKAREIEEDVILALTGLRSDLHQKIKEIKNLAGDFKNSVDKEMDSTRRAVNQLQDVLGQAELDTALTTGKQDPYLLRIAVDRQLERQIDEENYLHQAYLNLESSGKELESIVVGEIQKAYNAYAGILKRESDAAYGAIEELRIGPITMPKDTEWVSFIQRDDRFVDPDLPMRSAEFIHYPGRDHYACQEIRAGLLERKSKYLKSYTAGWYVLSPTHLHEYKSADKTQAPVMSLYLPEQKLGSHSQEGGSSNKFVLKGRQTGTMHRGHTWVFRAESHDTMMAWYDDIKTLTERTPEERSNLVRGNSRSISRTSQRSSISSDGVADDDEDPPFAATVASVNQQPKQDALSRRPSGGRFPSDLQVNAQRGLQVPISPLSVSSGYGETPDDYFTTESAPPGNQFGRQPPGTQEAGQAPRTQRSDLQYATNIDGHSGGTNQVPRTVGSIDNPALTGANTSTMYTNGDGLARAGPIPVPIPIAKQPQIPLQDDGLGARKGEAQAARDGEKATESQMNGDATGQGKKNRPGGTARNDSVPTISHLHIPGEYPRGSNAGL
ncbi:phosphatidylinositol 4,5-bisphosphate-binding protein [Madurella fahalii]|uniref:Phosphatidylinositol 4,5-bisphosphate-binding protein n=1 Tax=Madurella fahalii TaxID=1157608 RepID=A0ABQ0GHR4_9PEZI